MGDKSNYAALEWVIGEIGETLNDARQALEAYVEDPRDSARIRFCLTHIHQVHGSLQMVEFHGASLFAEEMEALASAIMHGKVVNEKEAQEVLMRSLLQLPHYLEQVKTYHDDHPGIVLPLLNDIRAVRKQSYLSETNLFNPDLSSLAQVTGERHSILSDPAKLKQVFGKLREMYQYAAASVLRGHKIDENLVYIDKAFVRMEGITRGTRAHALWQVSAALVEALSRDDVELSVAVRGLLRQLARELKILEEHCPQALDAPVNEALLRNLLFYIARAEDGGRRVAQVKERFGLNNALLGGAAEQGKAKPGMMSGPEPSAIRAVVVALQDELNTVKHLMNLALSGQGGVSDIEEMLPIVKRIGDTLAVLGIGDMRKLTMDQHEVLRKMVAGGKLVDTDLIDVAGRLADIEHRLEAIAKGAGKRPDYATADQRELEIDAAKEAVLSECRAGLERVKDAIVVAMSAQWNPSGLPDAIATLRDIEGGLNMVPLARPANILARCGRYIEEQLATSEETPGEDLQVLADAIASVDYFLERLSGTHGDELDTYLDVAEESLAQLGYGVLTNNTAPTPAPVAFEPEPEPAIAELELEPEAILEAIEAPASTESAEEFLTAQEAALDANAEIVAPAPVATPDIAAAIAPAAPVASAEPEALLPSEQQVRGDSELDDEIIDIFIEEAGEVLDTLGQYFPKWQANLDDSESLTVVRRAFHTLKGSGRMVEALDVGELAWAVENMLNRIIDATVPVQNAHALLIERVIAFTPSLVAAFKNQTPNPNKTLWFKLQGQAQALAKGEVPLELAGTGGFELVPPPEEADSSDAVELETSEDSFFADAITEVEPSIDEAYAPAAVAEVAEEEDEDQLLWDIFASEAATHLAVVDQFLTVMAEAAPLYSPPTDALQSALHTLKGSAHMAGVKPIAAIITPLEGFFKELRSYQLKVDNDILGLLSDASLYTREGLACIARHEPVVITKQEPFIARVAELHSKMIEPLIHAKEQSAANDTLADPKLLALFMSKEMNLLLDADEYIDKWREDAESLNGDLAPMRAELATLEQGATQANLPHMQSLSGLLGQVYEAMESGAVAANEPLFDLLKPAHESLLDMVDQVAAGQNVVPIDASLRTALEALLSEPSLQVDDIGLSSSELIEVESDELAADNSDTTLEREEVVSEQPDSWLGESEAPALLDTDTPDTDSPWTGEDYLTGNASDSESLLSAEPAETDSVEEYELPVEDYIVEDDAAEFDLSESTVSESTVSEAQSLPEDSTWQQDSAIEFGGDLSFGGTSEPFAANEEASTPELPEYSEAEVSEFNDFSGLGFESESPLEQDQEPEPPVLQEVQETAVAEQDSAADVAAIDSDDFDPDILEIFLDEANELIEELDESIHKWESNWQDEDAPEAMKRALHTLKGGARLSSLSRLGDLTHNYESFLIATREPSEAFFENVHQYQDTLLNAVKVVRARLDGENVAAVDAPAIEVPELSPEESEEVRQEEAVIAAVSDAPAAEILPFKPRTENSAANDLLEQNRALMEAATAKRQGSQEMIKVSADLLEELVNLAGETSISRGRLEQQVSDLSGAVDEVDATLRRLNEQLRRLDIETEAQVLFRQERMAQHEQFDPLEMDRYSHLQQLTRSLMESSSDLMDLKLTISDKLRDTETLLLQQQRINSSLQEGLMRSRMVPFSRLVPRLRRIVRQVSGELGKHVNFELDNVEGEMDRSVLERMVAPLEHMLRNAVDHGIEDPDARQSAGKPETGRILLSLAREGGDILLRLADDGRGINLERVRAKAIERGLMTEDSALTDHDVMQFILQAGFSTAENVTQISGRGVGMDVVAAEIKQLGGSMTIDSKPGVGTQFVVRLPFTVSVNRALMVQLGAEVYAIPLNTIEGIVRVSPFELEHYFTHEEARFEYAGENYQVRYLGQMVTPDLQPKLEGQLLPLPVILVRTGQLTMALQVDALSGSREIVVKSLGPQFATVQGISGATVMGDGSVVVILDPHALVRKEMAQTGISLTALEHRTSDKALPHVPTVRTIMVVDDSVTVRKVTTRFLEREGFNVITAKDGVDALQVLQESTPDLMLLDIEMPRMDGFEVAKNMRSTQRWKRTPIIMITSRTGDKHRQHAFSIGVNEYMGKPYQEESLLKAINALLAKQSVRA